MQANKQLIKSYRLIVPQTEVLPYFHFNSILLYLSLSSPELEHFTLRFNLLTINIQYFYCFN